MYFLAFVLYIIFTYVKYFIFFQFLYLTYGTQQVMERGFRDLNQRLELYLDGKVVELPSIESIVVLNIPSWGAGVQLWNRGTGKYHKINQGN